MPLWAPGCDFALLLSGGLDSSVLAYLMRPPVCVTVRYRGHDRLDESVLAAELVVVEPDPLDFPEALPDMMGALDYPMGNASTFLASSTKKPASQSPTWTSSSRSVTSTALAN